VAPTYGYNLLDSSQLQYLTTLGLSPALSYLPFPAAGPPTVAGTTHVAAVPLAGPPAQPLIADYNAAAAGGAAGGVDPAYSYSNTSSFTVAASPCLPMFFSSETSFQLSTSPCPSDASLTASQVNYWLALQLTYKLPFPVFFIPINVFMSVL